MARVAIIDPQHPLFGQRFDLSPLDAAQRPGWVSIVLADGRRRWVPRAATDLDGVRESLSSHALPCVSVRTLLPLMQYVRTLHSNPRVPDGSPLRPDQLESRARPSERAAGAGAEGVVGNDARGSAASGTAIGSAASSDADGARRSRAERGGSC